MNDPNDDGSFEYYQQNPEGEQPQEYYHCLLYTSDAAETERV